MSKKPSFLVIDALNLSLKEVLLDWGFGYPELAGCREEFLGDDDIDDDYSFLLPESGDKIVFNVRENGEFLGIDHEGLEIVDVVLNESSDYYDAELLEPQNPRDVPTGDLWERYLSIAMMFSDIHDRVDPKLDFKSRKALLKSYEAEVLSLSEDLYLSLYWLILYGLLGDKRYFDRTLKVCYQDHRFIAECSALFKDNSFIESVDLSSDVHRDEKDFFKTVFKKRIANLKKRYM